VLDAWVAVVGVGWVALLVWPVPCDGDVEDGDAGADCPQAATSTESPARPARRKKVPLLIVVRPEPISAIALFSFFYFPRVSERLHMHPTGLSCL